MRISIIGGGPAGLYFAILMKRTDPAYEVTVYERNGPDDTFGWGVVFSGKTLANLKAADEESFRQITDSFQTWDNVDVRHRDQQVTIRGNHFSGIARLELLRILHRRCLQLGVELKFRADLSPADIAALRDTSNLVIGADGVNSTVRREYAKVFEPTLGVRTNRYIWYGTHRLFHGLTLTFRENPDGVFAAHSYKFNESTSTFIIECDEQTWRRAGFAEMTDAATRSYLEQVFAPDLDGHSLLSNNSKWINFLLVKNASWSYGNMVLLGDALHTAHFSIGSGTKLAFEDAIALHKCFAGSADVRSALEEFEKVRKPVIEEYQAAAYDSMVWFENARQYMHLDPVELAYVLMTRSGKVDRDSLQRRDPEFVARYEASRESNCFRAGTKVKTGKGWRVIEEIQPGELVLSYENGLRMVVSLQKRPHVGRLLGLRLRSNIGIVWVTPDQCFLAPSPQAERGLGGKEEAPANPTPNPSPRAGRGKNAEVQWKLGGTSPTTAYLARQLRKDSTSAERILWECLRGRRLAGAKFRRQHPLGTNYIADFYCSEVGLAIELDGSVHDSNKGRWADGIRHRQLAVSGVKFLRFENSRVFDDLDGLLHQIAQYLVASNPQPEGSEERPKWRIAKDLLPGDRLIIDEHGRVEFIESVDQIVVNESVYDLVLERNSPFITEAGVVRSLHTSEVQ
ncbi:MAG: anthraniloyl-CoA monooxygenase [Blastocatellia bacterium]|jgi:2-polyprenyl-6-methoxyphenol hydroxylase-like FAD-dependent oxidoreductase/very-short-patch-repair endonuclease|nr:anthraniloyl-CoA monooxygenase [Blastocatellia bacterium]